MPDRSDPADAWLDDLAEGVVLVRSERIGRINRAAAELLGVTRERAIGQAVIAVLRDHRLERVWREGRSAELTVRGRRIQAVPIRGGLALRNVEEARAAAEHARELLAVLSHELRTPLTTVRSTLDALGYDDLPAENRTAFLERAVGEADRVVRLLDDLTLQVAPPRERSVPIREAVARVRALLAPVLEARGVGIREDLPDATVWVDPDKLVQVLLNLLENAALHGPECGEVTLTATEEDGWVRIVVADDGAPLPPERFETLFSAHARGAGARGDGAGLGLYVVRSIVARWGGRTWGQQRREGGDVASGNAFGVLVPSHRDPRPSPPPSTSTPPTD